MTTWAEIFDFRVGSQFKLVTHPRPTPHVELDPVEFGSDVYTSSSLVRLLT